MHSFINFFKRKQSLNASNVTGMKWDLSFTNSEWENIYQTSKQKYHLSLLKVIAFLVMMLCIIHIALDPYTDRINQKAKIIAYAIYFLIICMPMLLACYKKKYSEICLAIDVTLCLLGSMENFEARKNFMAPVFYYVGGALFSSILVCLLVGRVSWKYCGIVILISTLLLNFR